jgi:hypothetical protein
VQTDSRRKPVHVKRQIVRRRELEVLTLRSEEYAEFEYQPTACDRTYRMASARSPTLWPTLTTPPKLTFYVRLFEG